MKPSEVLRQSKKLVAEGERSAEALIRYTGSASSAYPFYFDYLKKANHESDFREFEKTHSREEILQAWDRAIALAEEAEG